MQYPRKEHAIVPQGLAANRRLCRCIEVDSSDIVGWNVFDDDAFHSQREFVFLRTASLYCSQNWTADVQSRS
jgi:hypothetical protein